MCIFLPSCILYADDRVIMNGQRLEGVTAALYNNLRSVPLGDMWDAKN
jgi:hypothetical protein